VAADRILDLVKNRLQKLAHHSSEDVIGNGTVIIVTSTMAHVFYVSQTFDGRNLTKK
jgi:hypothetical protein